MRNLRVLGATVALLVSLGFLFSYVQASDQKEAPGLRPDLQVVALDNIYVDNESNPGQKQLRFPTTTVNKGEGPFDFEANRLNARSTHWDVVQRILRTDGTRGNYKTDANIFFKGDGHDHWHVDGINHWVLQNKYGEVVAEGLKRGFCFNDNQKVASMVGTAPNSPAHAAYTGRGGACSIAQPWTTRVTEGLSPGWGDLYDVDLPNQFLDVTGLPNGKYRLTVTVDWKHWFMETDEYNNDGWAEFKMKGDTIRLIRNGGASLQ